MNVDELMACGGNIYIQDIYKDVYDFFGYLDSEGFKWRSGNSLLDFDYHLFKTIAEGRKNHCSLLFFSNKTICVDAINPDTINFKFNKNNYEVDLI